MALKVIPSRPGIWPGILRGRRRSASISPDAILTPRSRLPGPPRFGIVAAASNESHDRKATNSAVRSVVDHLDPPLSSVIKRGDRVVVKVNMGCSGFRDPAERLTSHPAYVEGILECLVDCGARVTLGDDVARTSKYQRIWQTTGMSDVARRTGTRLVDFVQAGGREVRGFLRFPKTHLVTNVVLDADVIINAASCRSLSKVLLSGAIKNMFGTVLGLRKLAIHSLFPDPSDFARVIVDVHRVVQPTVSFLDATTVRDGLVEAIRPVGLILGGHDAVAIDTVAAHAIGYEELTMWTTIHGHAVGLGLNDIARITIKGLDWGGFEKKRLPHPAPEPFHHESLVDRVSRRLNNAILRPRPVIETDKCTGCGACADRCPVDAISRGGHERFVIDLRRCADCGCCLKVCETGAVHRQFVGIAKIARRLSGTLRDGTLER